MENAEVAARREVAVTRRFLSKNPTFSPKIESINQTFPDAKIICMVRSPLEVVPSALSIASYLYNTFGSPLSAHPLPEFTADYLSHWYTYPLKTLADWPDLRKNIIKYTTITKNPEQTITALYDRFNLQMSLRYRQVLHEETQQAHGFKSRHTYSFEQLGLSREKIIDNYREIFEQFSFDTPQTQSTQTDEVTLQ